MAEITIPDTGDGRPPEIPVTVPLTVPVPLVNGNLPTVKRVVLAPSKSRGEDDC